MKRHIILAAILLLSTASLRAQYDETNNLLYHAFRSPQSNLLNPAFFPRQNTLYLTLPALGFQYGAPLGIDDLMQYNKEANKIRIDIDHIAEQLNNNSLLHLGNDINLVGFGLRINNLFFNINTRAVSDINFTFPADIINFIRQGNVGPDNQPIEEITFANGNILNGQAYLEGSIGGGYHIEPLNLTIGAHIKLLYGLFNLQTGNTSITLRTAPDFDSIEATIHYELQQAACAPYDTSLGQLILDRSALLDLRNQNLGVAFDLGARLDLGPLTLSFAINDLSRGIHWHHNTNTIAPENGHVHLVFRGLDSEDIDSDAGTTETTSQFDHIVDDLQPVHTQNNADYYFGVPTKINLGASLTLANLIRVGLILHGRLDRGLLTRQSTNPIPQHFRFNATATVGLHLTNHLEAIAGNSAVFDGGKLDLINPGVGLILKGLTPIQTYFMADYMSDLYLVKAKAFRINFGFNILIGKGHNK